MMRQMRSCHIALLGMLAVASGMRMIGNQDSTSSTKLTGPKFCDDTVVKETCDLIAGEDGLIHFEALKKVLAASSVLDKLWVTVVEPKLAGVTCLKLCELTVGFLKGTIAMPPASDIGCYTAGGQTNCDVDLSPDAIKGFVNASADIPRADDHTPEIDFNGTVPSMPAAVASRSFLDDIWAAGQELRALALRIVNLFRIYPDVGGSVSFSSTLPSSLIEAHKLQDWEEDVGKVNVQAKAYLDQAIRKFGSHSTKKEIDFWFGAGTFENDERRTQIQIIMNSVKNLLNNVEFASVDCASNVFAYVYPRANGDSVKEKCAGRQPSYNEKCVKNNRNQFVFYLCPLYMKSDTGTKIETLLHEGSHHYDAYTTDVCMNEFFHNHAKTEYKQVSVSSIINDGGLVEPLGALVDVYDDAAIGGFVWSKTRTAATIKVLHDADDYCGVSGSVTGYGQGLCATLARLEPQKAIRNADSFCYYIAHVVSGFSNAGNCQKAGDNLCVGDHVEDDQGRQGIVQFPYYEIGTDVEARDKDTEPWETDCFVKSNLFTLGIYCGKYGAPFGFNQVRLPSWKGSPEVSVRWGNDKLAVLELENDLSWSKNGPGSPTPSPPTPSPTPGISDDGFRIGDCVEVLSYTTNTWYQAEVCTIDPFTTIFPPDSCKTASVHEWQKADRQVWQKLRGCDEGSSIGSQLSLMVLGFVTAFASTSLS